MMSVPPRPSFTSSRFDSGSHLRGAIRWINRDGEAEIACDLMASSLTLDAAAIAKGGTLRVSGLHTDGYDRLSVFVRATSQEATPARLTLAANDAAGHPSVAPITFEAHSQAIVSRAIDMAAAAVCEVTLRVQPNLDLHQLEVKIGLYRRSVLSELADRFGSDKGTLTAHSLIYGAHGYAEVYDRACLPFKDQPTAILEIGLHTPSVYTGAPTDAPSLRLWSEYFSNAAVVGFDCNDFTAVTIEGATILRGDQSKREDLQGALRACPGGYNIVVDDGSHQSSHQQISLAALFPALMHGGLYVIEDLSWQPDPSEAPTTVEVLRRWGETGLLESPFMTDQERQFLMQQTDSIELAVPFNCEVAILRRR